MPLPSLRPLKKKLGQLSQLFLKSRKPVSKPGPVRSPVRYPREKSGPLRCPVDPPSKKPGPLRWPVWTPPKKPGPLRSPTGDRTGPHRWPHLWKIHWTRHLLHGKVSLVLEKVTNLFVGLSWTAQNAWKYSCCRPDTVRRILWFFSLYLSGNLPD